MTKTILNWSGGKDSARALYELQRQPGTLEISQLVTTISMAYDRITQHGVKTELLLKQADAIGLPLYCIYLPDSPTMENYNRMMSRSFHYFKTCGYSDTVYGDIFLENLRSFREEKASEMGFKAHFPLWKRSTEELARSFVDAGFKAITVCVDDRYLGEDFIGREYNHQFLDDLPDGVDLCGEYGEFHTFVYDGPVFSSPVPVRKAEIVHRYHEKPESDSSDSDTGENSSANSGQSDFNASSDHSSENPGCWYCELVEDD